MTRTCSDVIIGLRTGTGAGLEERLYKFIIKHECNIRSVTNIKTNSDNMQNTPHHCISTDFPLDILGQQPRINRLYTQITFCYPQVGDDKIHSQSEIIQTIASGFQRLSEAFPWISGNIRHENRIFMIKPDTSRPHIVVKDYTNDPSVPEWTALQQAGFPFSMLDESFLAPCKTLEPSSDNLLVFIIQANFVRGGGLLLTVNGQHGSMDMAGQGQMMYLFAKACRREPFTEDEIATGNMDRRNVIPLLNHHLHIQESVHDRPHMDNSPLSQGGKVQQVQQSQPQLSSNDCTWVYFSFSHTKLLFLKSQATATLPRGANDFVSTDDVLSAFVWQSISRIRLQRYIQSNDFSSIPKTTLSRNVNVRQHLRIPASYPGLVTNATLHTFQLDEVANQSLGFLSSQLRSALDSESLNQSTRELATRISRDKNGTSATIVPKGHPELDVRLSSWAKEKCYSLDFGFGLPVAVRRPRFTDGSREGLVYFLPKTLDGEIVVGICLRHDDMERLKNDEYFVTFGTVLG